MPEALPIVSTVPKPSVAQNLLLRRPAPVAHIAVGSHPDENEIGRNVLIHCRRLDFVQRVIGRVMQISEVAPHFPRPQPTLMRAEMALDTASSNTFVAENLTFAAEVKLQAEAE